MKGLLGRSELRPGEGLLLRPASAIHTFFMRFPIDAVFLDREWRVVGIADDVAPWRTAARKGAKAVLELPAGNPRGAASAPATCSSRSLDGPSGFL